MKRTDVAIIGGGVMGCATAWALARAGREVVLFEQFDIGHARGSSHGSARIFRESYTDPAYVRMMREAIPLWRELEDEAGEQLLAVTGALNLGDVEPLERAMAEAGSPFEILEGAELTGRFPNVDAGERAIFDPTAGVVFAERAWRAFAAAARAHGATIVQNARATFTVHDDRVDVNEIKASCVVLACGPWIADLMPDLPVRTTRETVCYYDAAELPVLIEWDRPLVYGLPTPDGIYKAGRHIAGTAVHPGSATTHDEDSARMVDDWMSSRVQSRAVRRIGAETCMYTNTEDECFIVRREGRVVVGSTCSGHGFK
ncbi:MAG: FAD-dependent oxidoreductase, partial [Actinobacteria bacterium]|nr:FAD-dependent oxidoreductase [Actinomycetota bacterium]